MFLKKKIAIIGGDLRQVYMSNMLLEKGYEVTTYGINHSMLDSLCKRGDSLESVISSNPIIVGPIPMSRDGIKIVASEEREDLVLDNFIKYLSKDHLFFAGNIPEQLETQCKQNHIVFVDFMKDKQIPIYNAIATAEGAIMEGIKNSTCNLHNSKCLVLGFGRCGMILAKKLRAMDAKVFIGARNLEQLAYANAYGYESLPLTQLERHIKEFQYIYNTVPGMILNERILSKISPDVTIIDLASAPGGVDYHAARARKLNAHLCLGIPGKVAPKASAKILINTMIPIIEERSD